jgi:hypothetical protein
MNEPEEVPLSLAERLLGVETVDAARIIGREQVDQALEESHWNPVDIEPALAGLRPPPPALLRREDGKHLLYRNKIHWVAAEPGSGKSFFAQYACMQTLHDGGQVLYLDYESEATDVVSRLKDMGVPKDVLRKQFVYVHPEGGTTMSPGDQAAYTRTVNSRQWTLAILDGTTDSIALEGLDANSGADITRWLHAIPRRLKTAGATILVIDHVVKSSEGRGRWAIGSGHKLAGLDGVSFTLEVIVPFAKAIGKDSHEGKSRLGVGKDRGGDVQALTADDNKTLGMFCMTAYADGTLDPSITADADSSNMAVPYEVFVNIARVLKTYAGSTQKGVVDRTGLSEHETAAGLMLMVEHGWVNVEAIGQSHKHTLTQSGQREFRDDPAVDPEPF